MESLKQVWERRALQPNFVRDTILNPISDWDILGLSITYLNREEEDRTTGCYGNTEVPERIKQGWIYHMMVAEYLFRHRDMLAQYLAGDIGYFTVLSHAEVYEYET